MKILKINEPEEGEKFCNMECVFSEEEIEILLSYAVTNILKEQIKRMERVCYDCGGEIDNDTLHDHPDTEICGDCLEEDKHEQGTGGG